jgi:UDP-N-acetylmuramoyl-L-alanyl-D-glutamate--2,6-diaminopimelate ligase
MMKIKKLIRDLPDVELKGPKEISINGVCSNSALVAPGNLFIAKKGLSDDGSKYISKAIEAGAVAVATNMYDPTLKDIAQIIHPNIASIESEIASTFHLKPTQDLFMVGITGTNGKTTTSYMVKQLLNAIDKPCGLIGTVEYVIGKQSFPATHTTPDVCTNQKLLHEMLHNGCESAVMEVSSHALEQQRVEGIEFDIAIFTNLTPEHLDYHHTMESYAAAKQKLFLSLDPSKIKKLASWTKTGIINCDDPWHKKISENCKAPIVTYAIKEKADLKASNIRLNAACSNFTLTYQNQTASCEIPFIGRHNIYNFMASVAVGLVKQISLENVVELISKTFAVPGRLEKVENVLGLNIYVDFAHSADSLYNVLSCLHELKRGRLITVFGCGGDRDKTKRVPMAKAAEQFSDFSIITSDNPRSEDPMDICQQVAKGFSSSKSFYIEPERRTAIENAIKMATPEDIVLVAGKGHESQQIFAHHTVPFDDREVIREICASKF